MTKSVYCLFSEEAKQVVSTPYNCTYRINSAIRRCLSARLEVHFNYNNNNY